MVKVKNPGDLTYDGRFKYVFKSKDLRFFVANIVSDILNLEYEYVIDNMEYVDTEHANNKQQSRSDVIVKIDKYYIIFEMNRGNYSYLIEDKMRYAFSIFNHFYKEDSKNNNKKKKKKKKKKRSQFSGIFVILINLNCFNRKNKDYIDYNYLCNKQKQIYSKYIKFIDYYLAKIVEKWYNEFTISKLEKRLAYLLITNESEETIADFTKGDDILMAIDKIRQQIKRGDIIIDPTYKEELDAQYEAMKKYALKEARREAKAEGRAEGRTEGKSEEKNFIASNLKKSGIASDIIAKCTGLSIDKIAAL